MPHVEPVEYCAADILQFRTVGALTMTFVDTAGDEHKVAFSPTGPRFVRCRDVPSLIHWLSPSGRVAGSCYETDCIYIHRTRTHIEFGVTVRKWDAHCRTKETCRYCTSSILQVFKKQKIRGLEQVVQYGGETPCRGE